MIGGAAISVINASRAGGGLSTDGAFWCLVAIVAMGAVGLIWLAWSMWKDRER